MVVWHAEARGISANEYQDSSYRRIDKSKKVLIMVVFHAEARDISANEYQDSSYRRNDKTFLNL